MQIVIDIDEDTYEYIRGLNEKYTDYQTTMLLYHAVRNGTPLPKGHGRLIDADYVINHICESKECYKENCKGKLYMRCIDIMWVEDAPTIIEAEEVQDADSN